MSNGRASRCDAGVRPPLIVFSDAPQAFAPRAAWTLQTMLAPLGRRLVLTREPAHAGGAALAYTSAPVPGVPTIPCSAAALALLAGRPAAAGRRFRAAVKRRRQRRGRLRGGSPRRPF